MRMLEGFVRFIGTGQKPTYNVINLPGAVYWQSLRFRGTDVIIQYDRGNNSVSILVNEGEAELINSQTRESRSITAGQKLLINNDIPGQVQSMPAAQWQAMASKVNMPNANYTQAMNPDPDVSIPVNYIPALNAAVDEVRFYGGGINGVPLRQRVYGEKFSKFGLMYMYWELNLSHPDPRRRIDFSIDAIWYKEDGSEFARQTLNTNLQKSWTVSNHANGRGWREEGKWQPGTYTIVLSHQGTVIAVDSFTIFDMEPSTQNSFTISNLKAEVKELLFFEGGAGEFSLDQRRYDNIFAKNTTRYINWELSLDHSAPGQRIDFNIEAVWYKEDGSIMGSQTQKTFINPDWQNSKHTLGWGWKDAGYWTEGKYRVELSIGGKKIISGWFSIENKY